MGARIPATERETKDRRKPGRESARLRVAIYSPGLIGLGHIRRNAAIAQALRSALGPVIVMIAEARQVGALPMLSGVDCVTLPAHRPGAAADECPRFLDISNRDLVALRTAVIGTAFESFEPDALIVDHLPLGTADELRRPLQRLRKRGNTCCVLGVRDVPPAPKNAECHAWPDRATAAAIREYFDAVWVYGDPAVYDPVHESSGFPRITVPVHYTGYLDERARLALTTDHGPTPAAWPGRLALCVVGRGHDAEALAQAFLEAELPPHCTGLVVTGTTIEEATLRRLRRRARRRPHMNLLERVPDPAPLIRHAERVVAMGGYHTMCEVLSFERHALIVPRFRTAPEHEQWIRATRMRDLGLVDVLDPRQVSPSALSDWLSRELGPPPESRRLIDFGGLTRIPKLLGELLGTTEPLARAVGAPA
jgi:predicted glycosyltransferase